MVGYAECVIAILKISLYPSAAMKVEPATFRNALSLELIRNMPSISIPPPLFAFPVTIDLSQPIFEAKAYRIWF